MSEKNIIEIVKKLVELYQKRDSINVLIDALHRELETLDEELKKKEKKEKKRNSQPRGFQYPSWEILELVPREGVTTTQEVWLKSQRYYGNRYTYTAVVSSLRRLVRGNLLSYDRGAYTRTEEGKRAVNPYTGQLSGTRFVSKGRK